MNQLRKIDAADWEVVTNDTYIMSEDDFPEGCLVVTDAASGRSRATGRVKLGLVTTVVLYTPLCGGCDEPVPSDGICSNCEVIHADIAEQNIGDPFLRRDAA